MFRDMGIKCLSFRSPFLFVTLNENELPPEIILKTRAWWNIEKTFGAETDFLISPIKFGYLVVFQQTTDECAPM